MHVARSARTRVADTNVASEPETRCHTTRIPGRLHPTGSGRCHPWNRSSVFKLPRGQPDGTLVPPHYYGASQCLHKALSVNGLPTNTLVDSGATTSCLSAAFYAKHHQHLPCLFCFNKPVTGADWGLLPVAGVTPTLNLQWRGVKPPRRFHSAIRDLAQGWNHGHGPPTSSRCQLPHL